MRRIKDDNSNIIFWIVSILFLGLSLPFLGIRYLFKPGEDNKFKGALMLAAGLAFWLFLLTI